MPFLDKIFNPEKYRKLEKEKTEEKEQVIKCRDDVADELIGKISKKLKELNMDKIVFKIVPEKDTTMRSSKTIDDKKYKYERRNWNIYVDNIRIDSIEEGCWDGKQTKLNMCAIEPELKIFHILKKCKQNLSKKAKKFVYETYSFGFWFEKKYCEFCKKETEHICHHVLPDKYTLGGDIDACMYCLKQKAKVPKC